MPSVQGRGARRAPPRAAMAAWRYAGLVALLALLRPAAGVKLKLAPYSTECVTEAAASVGDLVCVLRRARRGGLRAGV